MIFKTGNWYEGHWLNDKRHGKGKHVFYDESGEIERVEQGLFENDKFMESI